MNLRWFAGGASQFLAAFGQSDAETHEKRGTAEPRFASRLATILPLPEGEGRGEGAFDVSLTYQKIEMLQRPRSIQKMSFFSVQNVVTYYGINTELEIAEN